MNRQKGIARSSVTAFVPLPKLLWEQHSWWKSLAPWRAPIFPAWLKGGECPFQRGGPSGGSLKSRCLIHTKHVHISKHWSTSPALKRTWKCKEGWCPASQGLQHLGLLCPPSGMVGETRGVPRRLCPCSAPGGRAESLSSKQAQLTVLVKPMTFLGLRSWHFSQNKIVGERRSMLWLTSSL